MTVRPTLLVLTMLLASCGGDGGEQAHVGAPSTHDAETAVAHVVRLTPEQLSTFGVQIAAAGPGRIDRGIELLGEVRPNGERVAHIVPRFPGIVRDVRRTVGNDVRAGDLLATIESNASLAPYAMRTLLDGTIIERDLAVGEAVDRDKVAFVIADLSTVWVDLAVYQKDLSELRVGQAVRLAGGPGLPDVDGTIAYITPIVDEPTRTAAARVVLANADRVWRPGLFVTARVLDPIEAAIAVPPGAVQTVQGLPSVFVETSAGFELRPVVLGRRGRALVEVLDGLTPGERVVAVNSFLLKAELGKAEAGHED
jgi:cobalt-zinc-cadmium efflux system membrane fusion protein